MDEDSEFDEEMVEDVDAVEENFDYEAQIGRQRHDVRRKIEEMLERKRLREEFGELDDF